MQPLAVQALGMISCLGYNAEANAAMMRCGYSNSHYSDFTNPRNKKRFLMAEIEDLAMLRGEKKLSTMMVRAVENITGNECYKEALRDIPSAFSFPEEERSSYFLDETFITTLGDHFFSKFDTDCFRQESPYVRTGRTGFAHALVNAERMLYQGDAERVLVVCVDSLLSNQSLLYYLERSIDYQRVNDEKNSLGFIPGEAAVALLLGRPEPGREQTCITGVGFGHEEATIDSDEVLIGVGLTQAVREAVESANIPVSDTDFRISSTNGESYFFQEAALVAARVLEKKRESWPLWHPAEHIGEVGAAAGGAMVVMGHYAFIKGYAPGIRALCQLSNDDSQRAAFVLERMTLA